MAQGPSRWRRRHRRIKGRAMSLYTVRCRGQDQWLVYEDTESARIYAYVPNLSRFVFHNQLGQDFYWDNVLEWTSVTAAAGHAIAAAGIVGRLGGRRHGDLLAELAAEPDRRTTEEVFGAQSLPERTQPPQ